MTDPQSAVTGHRARLRSRFLSKPEEMTENQLVELLLTYAIPRHDVERLASHLLTEFGTIEHLLHTPRKRLLAVDGVGENTATLIQLVAVLTEQAESGRSVQPRLFEDSHEEEDAHPVSATDVSEATGSEDEDLADESEPTVLRAFVNDEIANTIDLLPYAPTYPSIDEYRQFLRERLPYNSETTRRRRANHMIDRFFPDQRMHRLLLFFLKQNTSRQSLNEVIFYHLLKAEKLAARVAEDFVWPALPVARVDREEMRSFVLGILPDLSKSSQKNTLRALVTAYDLLGIGQLNQATLYFRTRYGTLDSFLYVLLAECPKPGIYAFTALENGPMHRWLLWDRQWIRRQLYNLRDLDILTKVSEIDTVRQFSLALPQNDALAHYFAVDEAARLALREEPIGVAEPPATS